MRVKGRVRKEGYQIIRRDQSGMAEKEECTKVFT